MPTVLPMSQKRELTHEELEAARRLRQLWTERKSRLGLTQKKAGDRLDVSQGMVGHYLNGRRPMDAREVMLFAKMLQADPEEIWPGFRKQFGIRETGAYRTQPNTEPGPSLKGEHPVISWVQAGDPAIVEDPHQPGVAEEWHPCPVSCSPQTFILRVKGPSMEPDYQEGELIYVDPERPAEHGKDVVVRFEGQQEATFKRLVVDGGYYYLRALNPDWPRPFIPVDEDATLCGVVVFSGKIR
jgi:SOS-response transcriptional repressor LexA